MPQALCPFVLLLLVGIAPSAAVAKAPASGGGSDPAAIASAIYERAAKGIGDSGGQFLWIDPKDRPRAFSAALVHLWARADAETLSGDIGPIDFDPVTNSQDPRLKSFSVVTERQSASAATVAVTFTERGSRRPAADRTVRYDFVRESGGWKIDDIRGSADGQRWSLRTMLTQSLKH